MSKQFHLTILASTLLSCFAFAPQASFSQEAVKLDKNDLVSIKTTEDGANQHLIFEFAGGKPAVRTFKLSNPNRLVLDFSNTTNRSQTGGISYQGIGVQSLDIAGDDTRLRTVVSLYDDTQVTDRWNGTQYTLILTRKSAKQTQVARGGALAATMPATMPAATPATMPAATPATRPAATPATRPAATPATRPAATPATRPAATPAIMPAAMPAATPAATMPASPAKLDQEILKIDFRKGKTPGSGRLIVDLTNADTPIDIKTTKGGLIIDFMKTNVPASLARKFELSDQMTPASSMEIKQLPDRTRLLLRTQGKWEQSAHQIENRFVFEIKPIFNDTMSKDSAEGSLFKGDKLTLNFQNVEVRTILQVLADFSGFNIITSENVGGNLTLRLKEVPWDQALELILQTKNLDKRQVGNVIWIAPQAEIRNKDKSDAEARSEQADNQPLVTESFEINYAKASEVKTLLGDAAQKILSKRGSVVVDARTNMIFVQDIADRITAARAMIKKIDIPVKQVMVDARIVEAGDTFGKSLGARLGFNQGTPARLTAGSQVVIGGGVGNGANTSGQGNGANFSDTYFTNLPAQGSSSGAAAGLLSLILFNNSATRFLNLELSAMVADGRGQILSNPRVVTSDGTEASIEQGTQIPYQQASSSGATAVSFKTAALSMKVKPHITPNGDVMMDIAINKDGVGVNTTAGPSIDTKSIKTQVLIEDGGTVVIGGIYTQADNVDESRIPFFGDLPYIGNIFKTRTTLRERKEMLVFITPKIVADRTVSDDLDAVTIKEDLIKPIMMDKEHVNGKNGMDYLPSLPNDKTKLKRSDIE